MADREYMYVFPRRVDGVLVAWRVRMRGYSWRQLRADAFDVWSALEIVDWCLTEPLYSLTQPLSSLTRPFHSLTEPLYSLTRPLSSLTEPLYSLTHHFTARPGHFLA